MFEKNKLSVQSIIDYHKKFRFRNIKYIFAGYCKDDKYWDCISGIIKNSGIGHCIRLEKNYGKAYIVNKIFAENYTNEDFLMSVDSDMLFDLNEYNIFRRLIKVANALPKKTKHEVGMLALNQTQAGCHMYNVMDRAANIEGEVLRWSSTGTGIAGGCILISTKAFKEIGGYRVMGVYSGDDGYLLRDINMKNMLSMITESISVIHPLNPGEETSKYQQWKTKSLSNCRVEDGKKVSIEEFNAAVIETEKQWDSEFKGVE